MINLILDDKLFNCTVYYLVNIRSCTNFSHPSVLTVATQSDNKDTNSCLTSKSELEVNFTHVV